MSNHTEKLKKEKRMVKYECLTCGYIRPGMYCFCLGGKGFKKTNKKLTQK